MITTTTKHDLVAASDFETVFLTVVNGDTAVAACGSSQGFDVRLSNVQAWMTPCAASALLRQLLAAGVTA